MNPTRGSLVFMATITSWAPNPACDSFCKRWINSSMTMRPSLGPGRSYQQVADRYGVTKRAVTALAKRESWQARLAEIEEKSRVRLD